MKQAHERIERTKRNRKLILPLLILCLLLEGRGHAYQTPQDWKDHALNPPAIVASATKFTNFNFSLPGNRSYVTLWLGGKSMDAHPGIVTDVLLENVRAKKVVGIDLLNGTEQDLVFTADNERTRIPRYGINAIDMMVFTTDVPGSPACSCAISRCF